MSGECDQPAAAPGSVDSHPWALPASRPPQITRRLLDGAEPVCCSCYRPLEPGEPRVTVPPSNPAGAVLLRCSDCEYRSLHG